MKKSYPLIQSVIRLVWAVSFLFFLLSFDQLSAQHIFLSKPFVCAIEKGEVDSLEGNDGEIYIVPPPVSNLHLQGASILVQVKGVDTGEDLLRGMGSFHFSVSVFDRKIELKDKKGHVSEGDVVTFDFDKDKRDIKIYAQNLLAKYGESFLISVRFMTAYLGENGDMIDNIEVNCVNRGR